MNCPKKTRCWREMRRSYGAVSKGFLPRPLQPPRDTHQQIREGSILKNFVGLTDSASFAIYAAAIFSHAYLRILSMVSKVETLLTITGISCIFKSSSTYDIGRLSNPVSTRAPPKLFPSCCSQFQEKNTHNREGKNRVYDFIRSILRARGRS